MEKFYKVGFVLFALCAIGWVVGYFAQNSLLSTICVVMAALILVVTEVMEYIKSNNLVHLIIPAIIVALCLIML